MAAVYEPADDFFLMSYNKVTITTGLLWKKGHFYCQFFGRRCFYKSFKMVCKSSRNCTTKLNAVFSQEAPFVRPFLGWPNQPLRGVLGENANEPSEGHLARDFPWSPHTALTEQTRA